MTVIVENNISEIKRFRECIKDTILFSCLDGFLQFINLNNKKIDTIVVDSDIDPEKVPAMLQYVKSMFPHINTVEYCDSLEQICYECQYHIAKPFEDEGKTLLETLSGK